MIKNWKSDFITDIVFSSTSSCPSSFEESYIGKWEGTYHGCDCLGIYCHRRGVSSNTLSLGVCNYNETLCGCSNVSSRPSAKLILVPAQDMICIKRKIGWNFESLNVLMNENGEC
jgi:hypothetical protein